ncbi:MAG: hypothetical protein ACLRHK_03090 [Coprococcus sp.]
MDEDKIIIIPEKYYMQIYQVGFGFLIIMSIICIAYGFFANENVGFTGKGTFTIIEEATGIVNAAGAKSRWGKLKSGRGWLCLDYAEKVG